jgi:hypothetical protein
VGGGDNSNRPRGEGRGGRGDRVRGRGRKMKLYQGWGKEGGGKEVMEGRGGTYTTNWWA